MGPLHVQISSCVEFSLVDISYFTLHSYENSTHIEMRSHDQIVLPVFSFHALVLFASATDVSFWFGLTSPDTILRVREWSDESVLNWVLVYFNCSMPQYLNVGSIIE